MTVFAGIPDAFGASWEDEASLPVAQFAHRLEHSIVFGARFMDDRRLQGVVGLSLPEARKTRHKGVLWGMYVRPEACRSGLGAALLARVIAHAATKVEEVTLAVGAENTAALRLYARAGFQQYGLEPRALKIDGRYHDEVLMTLRLDRPG